MYAASCCIIPREASACVIALCGVQVNGWRSVYGVIIAGCVMSLVTFLPLLSHMAASLPSAIAEHAMSSRISLPQATSLGLQKSELHFVDLSSAEEGRRGARSQLTNKGKYTAYSNPYAEDATESGTIQPTLAPLVRRCHTAQNRLVLHPRMYMHGSQ